MNPCSVRCCLAAGVRQMKSWSLRRSLLLIYGVHMWASLVCRMAWRQSPLLIKTLINCYASANVSKDMVHANKQRRLCPSLFIVSWISIRQPPCSLTNRVMRRIGMFRGWQLWQPLVEQWAIKGFRSTAECHILVLNDVKTVKALPSLEFFRETKMDRGESGDCY